MYEIKNETSPHLIKSLSKIVKCPTAIAATNVMTLHDYIKRSRHTTELYVALNLVKNFGKQMQALISSGWSIACMGVGDILVIMHRESDNFTHDFNDEHSTLGDARMDPQFLFLNDHLIFEVEPDGTINIDHSLPRKEAFMSPELQQHAKKGTMSLPISLHFKTIFYSAAQLFIYFLLNVDHIPEDDDTYLNPIKLTKLHWFLLRCLNPVPEERKYMYV
jgi:hypothetical protein